LIITLLLENPEIMNRSMAIDHRNAPTSNESNKNIVTCPDTAGKTRYENHVTRGFEMHHMDEVSCTRCGFSEVALVRKEMFGGGKYRKKWRCPRCSNTWETVDE